MANPTTQVPVSYADFLDLDKYWPIQTATTVQGSYFQQGELIGKRSDGTADHLDDTQALVFVGVNLDKTQYDNTLAYNRLKVRRPRLFSMPLSSGTGSNLTDYGKALYAADSGHVTYNPTALAYANLVGYMAGVKSVNPETLTATEVWISPAPIDITTDYSGVLTAPATGGKTYGVEVLNKTVLVPNTAAETLTLPAVANARIGDRVRFVKTTAAAFAVTLQGNAAENVNGANTYATSTSQWAVAEIENIDGIQWAVVTKI